MTVFQSLFVRNPLSPLPVQVLGEKHPRVRGTYTCMGDVYSAQGKYDEALKCDLPAQLTARI